MPWEALRQRSLWILTWHAPTGDFSIAAPLVWFWSLDQTSQPHGSQAQQPFLGCFLQPHLSLPPALDSPLLFPTWGAQHNCTAALVLTHRRWLEGSHCVCSLSPGGRWLSGAASSLGPWLLSARCQGWVDRALGLPQKTSAERPCSEDQGQKKGASPCSARPMGRQSPRKSGLLCLHMSGVTEGQGNSDPVP